MSESEMFVERVSEQDLIKIKRLSKSYFLLNAFYFDDDAQAVYNEMYEIVSKYTMSIGVRCWVAWRKEFKESIRESVGDRQLIL
ncbi:hypothetical protein [Enterococcus sp. AZ007]|uniref:hypothetical protein n=1 Tax=Enterococcus sp. AZ007 TaxID=2774839 RepID=UPI003F28CA3A